MVLLVNDFFFTHGLVNGSRGLVTAFRPTKNAKLGPMVVPDVKFDNGETVTIRPRMFTFTINSREERKSLQLPLNLAWAITVHKSQGMSISKLEVDISNCEGASLCSFICAVPFLRYKFFFLNAWKFESLFKGEMSMHGEAEAGSPPKIPRYCRKRSRDQIFDKCWETVNMRCWNRK